MSSATQSPVSSAQHELDSLLVRMSQRLYPETIPVLASYWLKTICGKGHPRAWWKDLHEQLEAVSGNHVVLAEIREWVQRSVLTPGTVPEPPAKEVEPFRPNLRPEWHVPYISRLLNQWLPAEVANVLVDGGEIAVQAEDAIPVLAVGRALERLLVRERLSPGTLETFLHPHLLSAADVYPADAEIFRDVVSFLLDRTSVAPLSATPAMVLAVASDALLPDDFSDAARRASLVNDAGEQDLEVPLTASQGQKISEADRLRIASILVTMDGRWWQADSLQGVPPHAVIYRPGERLRIDYARERARVRVPWPETQASWWGSVHFRETFELFGREWRASSWEMDGDRTWLNLEFLRAVPVADIQQSADSGFRRSRPAFVDMAWAALGNALASALAEKSADPIEQMRRAEFIPLGRAMVSLMEVMKTRRPKREPLETQLKAVRYLGTGFFEEYGRIPWGILPPPTQAAFRKLKTDDALLELLNQVFDGLPEGLNRTNPDFPSQAA